VPNKTKKRKRRIYTPEFKAEVINLIETSGKSIAQVARELELTDSAVRSWVEAARNALVRSGRRSCGGPQTLPSSRSRSCSRG
jgi:transposase-like protein